MTEPITNNQLPITNHQLPNFEEIIEAGKQSGHPRLSPDDCKLLYESALAISARRVLEIGAALGTSSIVLGLACKQTGGHVISIEHHPRNEWYSNIETYGLIDTVTLIQGLSPWVELPGWKSLDFLFIDGEHKTRWCLMDYHYWSHFVRPGGLIAFHDIYGPPAPKVNRAIDMIMEDERNNLTEVGKCPPARNGGTVIFEKIK